MKKLIFNTDFKNVLSKVPDKSVDLMITDPPYLHVKGGCKSKIFNTGVRAANSKVVSEMSDFDRDKIYDFLNSVKPKMKKFNAYVFCSKLQLPYYFDWALENKVQFDLLVWDKCNTGIISHKFFNPKYEYIIRLYTSGLNTIEDVMAYQKVQRYKVPSKKVHEAEKPVELLKNFIKLSSNENNIVLDPFMGSGSTGVACKELGRKFIGMEIDKKYYDIAKERMEKEDEVRN